MCRIRMMKIPMDGEAVNNDRMSSEGRLVAESLYQDQNNNSLVVAQSGVDGDIHIVGLDADGRLDR